MVTGDAQEEVMIFRDRQTLHHNIYITNITIIIKSAKDDIWDINELFISCQILENRGDICRGSWS